MKPAVIEPRIRQTASLEILRHDAVTADKDFSVRGDANPLALNRLPDRSAPRAQRMVHRHHRTRLGQSIALDNHETQLPPKNLQFRIQLRPPDDESPELPSQRSMNLAMLPPRLRRAEQSLKALCFNSGFKSPFDFIAKVAQQPRHRHENRNTFPMNCLEDRPGGSRAA